MGAHAVKGLGREDRKARRAAMATRVSLSGEMMKDVAAEFSVSVSTVHAACKESGVIPNRVSERCEVVGGYRVPKNMEVWEGVNWAKPDKEIAEATAMSKQRVHQVRAALGVPKSHLVRKAANVAWIKANAALVSQTMCKDLCGFVPYRTTAAGVAEQCKIAAVKTKKRIAFWKTLTKENLRSFTTISESGCWEWNLTRHPNGYACVGKDVYGHRLSYQLFHGRIPRGGWCLHRCDNPCCVNPDHIYLGTPEDNAQDREERHRGGQGRRIDSEVVNSIRSAAKDGLPAPAIAKQFSVHLNSVQRIVSGVSYKNVG